jgi:hypothetical protein
MGCHQGRSVAGFHVIGVDRAGTPQVNAVAVTGSPHFTRDQPRRLKFLEAVAAGKEPDAARPLSERADQGEGGFGTHCGLGDPGFSDWTCAPGLSCQSHGLAAGDETVGQCFPPALAVGAPCETGTLRPHADGRRDRIVKIHARSCGVGVCESNAVGFPDGMCATSCADAGPYAACGQIAILAGFNGCLAKGRAYTECLETNVRPAALKACDEATPCRDDYLCARTATGQGACIPPYFLFQMRVDGHPKAG